MSTKAYGTHAADKALEPIDIERRQPGPKDVRIEIAYCGICHSDLHQARSEWAGTLYPCVPGHEIVGRVTAKGPDVTKFEVGDTVGVGCMVDSCGHCHSCVSGHEQYCDEGFVGTYNGKTEDAPGHTLGGYAQHIVVTEDFVLDIKHPGDQLAAVAPLLCAGITTYSPLRHWNTGPGKKVGIVGIGGLGHMGVKLARALGARTVAFTTTESKREAALSLGAHEVVISRDPSAMAAHRNSFDLIVNTVSAPHDLDQFTTLLKSGGSLTLVGLPENPHPAPAYSELIFKRKAIAGSLIGGIAETQEMLDFCADKGIVADIEMIPVQKVNEAFDRMEASDVKYRFVIDNSTL